MKVRIIGNTRASETIQRIKDAGSRYDIEFVTQGEDEKLYYGVSDFTKSKEEQAKYFEDIIDNTIISQENYPVIEDYRYIVMKNPTRIMLWRDAKREHGTKYLYIKNRDEWRVNYSFGVVNSMLNKNVGNELMGKADLTTWTPETDCSTRNYLVSITKAIGQKLKESGSNLKSFGLDVIRDKDTGYWYLLELNQANSLSESSCERFLESFIKSLEENKRARIITDFINELTEEEQVDLWNQLTAKITRT